MVAFGMGLDCIYVCQVIHVGAPDDWNPTSKKQGEEVTMASRKLTLDIPCPRSFLVGLRIVIIECLVCVASSLECIISRCMNI